MNRHGFPRTDPKEKHPKHGFKTGDIVKAIVPAQLKRAGTHIGRMSAKASGSFTIATKSGTVTDVGKNYCRKLQRVDGYGYSHKECMMKDFPACGLFLSSHSLKAYGSPERTKDGFPIAIDYN
jgi:hypothetical protein